ncbi:MAG: hypothetical protein RB296_09930 [Acidobacteriota bacterium]|jgi:hypothetical protein|nr:hypothetical protein [Acidobacteriota bacterium]
MADMAALTVLYPVILLSHSTAMPSKNSCRMPCYYNHLRHFTTILMRNAGSRIHDLYFGVYTFIRTGPIGCSLATGTGGAVMYETGTFPAGSFVNDQDQPVYLREQSDKPVLLFLFERPCSTCTPSITFWMKVSELASKRAHIMGIIQDRVEMIRIAGTKRLPFQLISPVDDDEFVRT